MEVTSRSEGVCRSDGYSKNGCKNENEDSKEKFSPFCSQKNSAILQPLGLTSPIRQPGSLREHSKFYSSLFYL